MNLKAALTVLLVAGLFLSGCGNIDNLTNQQADTVKKDLLPTAGTSLAKFSKESASISLNDDEFKAAVSFWVSDIGTCELAFRNEGNLATYASEESIGPESFPYGSISKAFTAVLVLKMAELGKLSLNDKLSQFRMDIPADDSITLRELLTHTSGLPEYFYSVDPASKATRAQILSMIRSAAKKSDLPRGTFFYANTNYYLLGEICAQVGEAPLGELVGRYVCEPIGIKCHPGRLPTFDLNWYGGAGNLAGSIQDLADFGEAIAIHDKRLLSPESWTLLASPHVAMSKSGQDQYGYGLIVANMSIYPTLSHGGTVPANANVDPFVSMLIVRDGKFSPISFVGFCRVAWDSKSTNALYGAFSSVCATADLKRWIATFCEGVSSTQISGFVNSGRLGAGLGRLMSPGALVPLQRQIGTLKTFMVQGEEVHADSVALTGLAKGTAGTATVQAQFGSGGRLDSFGFK